MSRTINGISVDTFTEHYLVAALWSSMDGSTPSGGEPFDANQAYLPKEIAAKRFYAPSGSGEEAALRDRIAALRAALPTANIEQAGDRATMAYGSGGTVLLVREHGGWRIDDFD